MEEEDQISLLLKTVPVTQTPGYLHLAGWAPLRKYENNIGCKNNFDKRCCLCSPYWEGEGFYAPIQFYLQKWITIALPCLKRHFIHTGIHVFAIFYWYLFTYFLCSSCPGSAIFGHFRFSKDEKIPPRRKKLRWLHTSFHICSLTISKDGSVPFHKSW